MPVFKAAGNAYAIKFSPFDDRVAVSVSQNFGIIGNGKQYVLQVFLLLPYISVKIWYFRLRLISYTSE